ncbi:MAG: hypothetical protein K5864_07405 [Bacteroidales bacterium]|nr:hypothetical protein [Bacteroidales bacterium]
MKTTNTIFVRLSVICTIIMSVALLCAGMMEDIMVRYIISGVAVLFVWSAYAIHNMKRKYDFSAQAMALLTKAGLSCKRKEDGIVVKQGDFIMNAKLWNNGTHGMKRVHFMFDFAPTIIDSVLPEGWALLAAECNANYDHTMVKFYGDHFSCMVETSVKNAKDFLEEYRFAFEKINETMQGMQANADRVASLFPAKKRHVGFVIPEHQ